MQGFWMGLFLLNPDEGFAWIDGSPVSTYLLKVNCPSDFQNIQVFMFLCFSSNLFKILAGAGQHLTHQLKSCSAQ